MNHKTRLTRLLITSGEPAGIGPDACVMIAQRAWSEQLVFLGDPEIIQARAALLQIPLVLREWHEDNHQPAAEGEMLILPLQAPVQSYPGKLETANASYVLAMLKQATRLCLAHKADALVTAPVHKGVINDAGHAFSGHTEFLKDLCGVEHVLMLLVTEGLRVALATTHLPLRAVAENITQASLTQVLDILLQGLRTAFAIEHPTVLVAGLNPHAGEGGHLGDEEIRIIEPVLANFRARGERVKGPLPADTLFSHAMLDSCDAVLAMYHDQGLPVLKYKGFGQAVNITLGLPIIRTSVDHGTALDLAGSGRIDTGSLTTAINYAAEMVRLRRL